jgi:hypothetical protein
MAESSKGLKSLRSPNKSKLLDACDNCGKQRYNPCKCQKTVAESSRAMRRAERKYGKG